MESFRDHLKFLYQKSLEIRLDVLRMTQKSEFGYVGSTFSCIDLLVLLYYGKMYDRAIMQYNPQNPDWADQDYVVVSKGHAAPAWYATLADVGFFDKSELEHFAQLQSLLQGHPMKKVAGVPLTVPSLGHGFSQAFGLALALKMEKALNRVFCIVGDGELQEGQIWQAAMSAAHYKLDNLVLIVDHNKLQVDTTLRGVISVDPIAEKFEAFGWKVVPIRDGHNFEELLAVMERALEVQRRPTVIVAHTISGKGIPFAENKPSYHGVPLSEQEMAVAVPALERTIEHLATMD